MDERGFGGGGVGDFREIGEAGRGVDARCSSWFGDDERTTTDSGFEEIPEVLAI